MVRLLAKIRPHDLGIADDVFRLAVRYLFATYQNNESLREAHHRAHDMFDQDDGDPALIELFQERETCVPDLLPGFQVLAGALTVAMAASARGLRPAPPCLT